MNFNLHVKPKKQQQTVMITVLLLLLSLFLHGFLPILSNQLCSQETTPKILPKQTVYTPYTPSSVKFTPITPNAPGTASTNVRFSDTAKYEFYPLHFAENLRSIALLSERDPTVSELSQWAEKTLQHLEAAVFYINQNNPVEAWSHLKQLEKFTVELEILRKNLTTKNASTNLPPTKQSPTKQLSTKQLSTKQLSTGQPLTEQLFLSSSEQLLTEAEFPETEVQEFYPTATALEELLLGLERRLIIWGAAVQAETTHAFPISQYFGKKITDVQRLKERTLAVENYFLNKKNAVNYSEHIGELWCDYLDTRSFLADLEACQKMFYQPNRRVSTLVSTIPVPMLIAFCDRANVVLLRLNDPQLTENQRRYLNVPVLAAWKEELTNWSADTVTPITLIRSMERFEETGGMSDMETLFRLATRLSFSRTPALRQLGLLTGELYGGPNVKVYISKVLVNHLLPPSKPEIATFRDVIQQQPVFGRRRTDTDIEMNFIPAENRILLSLDVSGTVKTTSRANAAITTLLTGGQAEYEAQKQIELTENGFQLAPCHVQVRKNRLELLNFQTDFDRIPLLSGLVRIAVRNQYESRQPDAKSETQQKITRQVRERVNREADDRFKEFNEKYREFANELSNRFNLFLEKKDARTEENWLLTSWAVRSQDFLSGNTPAPETPPGSFADLKVHESVLNMLVGKLNFDSKTATVGEIRREVAEKFNRPQFAEPGEHDEVQMAFAKYNPIIIRFVDGRIEISITMDSLKIQRQTYRNFKVVVRYRPMVTDDGELVLKRDPVINLINVSRGQLVLRTAFTTIFPPNRSFSLKPQFIKNDPRFVGLTTGHCRLEKGWFAVALVANETKPY
ncbi:MAG: hypothetical protein LBG58_17075 [Planctomycetaceae bacterium]|nr:hypothetical protein [Planctomycetaceae bacterium]